MCDEDEVAISNRIGQLEEKKKVTSNFIFLLLFTSFVLLLSLSTSLHLTYFFLSSKCNFNRINDYIRVSFPSNRLSQDPIWNESHWLSFHQFTSLANTKLCIIYSECNKIPIENQSRTCPQHEYEKTFVFLKTKNGCFLHNRYKKWWKINFSNRLNGIQMIIMNKQICMANI